MKIAVLGDLHFICPDDPIASRVHRDFFENTEAFFQRQKELIQKEAVDLVISLGDLVDWYSDINRDYAIELMDSIGLPWKMVPGNHDFQMYPDITVDTPIHTKPGDTREICTQHWLERGIELHDRLMETDGCDLVFLENAPSQTLATTKNWLNGVLKGRTGVTLFAHVPLDTPEMRSYIHHKSPERDLRKYVCSRSPWIFETIQGHVDHVFTGHLHFAGELKVASTEMHMIPLGCRNSRVSGQGVGRITIYDTCSNHIVPIDLPH